MSDNLYYNGSNSLLVSMNKSSQPKLPKEGYPFTLDSNASSKLESDKLIPEEDPNMESPI